MKKRRDISHDANLVILLLFKPIAKQKIINANVHDPVLVRPQLHRCFCKYDPLLKTDMHQSNGRDTLIPFRYQVIIGLSYHCCLFIQIIGKHEWISVLEIQNIIKSKTDNLIFLHTAVNKILLI